MQFAYYGIINVMENALVFNTVLTGRYVQILFNTRQISVFLTSFHYSRFCFGTVNIMVIDFCCLLK